jgi:hypothetical protein
MMPDITMCCNCDCPIRSKCYRYLAKPNQDRQSFAFFEPTEITDYLTKCDMFWQLEPARHDYISLNVVDDRYKRDCKWKGLKDD